MKKLIILLFLSITFVQRNALANEACSRIAIINQQEFLVDPNLNRKGEGLRFYLARDEKAKELLEKYQNTSDQRLRSAIIGTSGALMLLGSTFVSGGNNKQALVIGGISTIFINFLSTYYSVLMEIFSKKTNRSISFFSIIYNCIKLSFSKKKW